MRELQQARLVGAPRILQGHDHSQQESLVAHRLDHAIAAHLPCIAQCLRAWARRRELSGFPARPREHLSTLGHEPRFLDVGLLAQTSKRGGLLASRGLGEIERHHMSFEKQFVQHDVERRPAEIESPL